MPPRLMKRFTIFIVDLLSIQATTFFHIATTPLLYIRLLSPIQSIIQVEHDSKIAILQLGVLVERIVTVLHVESFRLTENIVKAQRGIQTILEKTLAITSDAVKIQPPFTSLISFSVKVCPLEFFFVFLIIACFMNFLI